MASRDLAELLRRLARGEVACILVGGMAGVMRGAPVVTSDIDVVHLRRKNNVERLLRVLSDLDAVYRQDERRLRPSESHLMGPGHQLLTTRLGPIDLLGSLDGEDYEQLEASSSPMALGGDLTIKVLELEKLIELKRRTGRAKDIAVLPVLEATLDAARQKT